MYQVKFRVLVNNKIRFSHYKFENEETALKFGEQAFINADVLGYAVLSPEGDLLTIKFK